MNVFKMIWLTVCQSVLLPRTIARALKQKKDKAVARELNEERLDRIRNPSKYLGK